MSKVDLFACLFAVGVIAAIVIATTSALSNPAQAGAYEVTLYGGQYTQLISNGKTAVPTTRTYEKNWRCDRVQLVGPGVWALFDDATGEIIVVSGPVVIRKAGPDRE